MSQLDLLFPPASHREDSRAAHRADERQNASGKKLHDTTLVLKGLYAWPNTTSKRLAELCGFDRHMAGRRLPDLMHNGLVDRVEDPAEGWRWSLTAKGLAEVSRQNGFNPPGRR